MFLFLIKAKSIATIIAPYKSPMLTFRLISLCSIKSHKQRKWLKLPEVGHDEVI